MVDQSRISASIYDIRRGPRLETDGVQKLSHGILDHISGVFVEGPYGSVQNALPGNDVIPGSRIEDPEGDNRVIQGIHLPADDGLGRHNKLGAQDHCVDALVGLCSMGRLSVNGNGKVVGGSHQRA